MDADDWLANAKEPRFEPLVFGNWAARAFPPVVAGLRIGFVMVGGLVTLVIILLLINLINYKELTAKIA